MIDASSYHSYHEVYNSVSTKQQHVAEPHESEGGG